MKKIKLYLIAVSVLSIIVFACKKQQPQINEDIKNPCDCAHEVSAEFKMEETGGLFTTYEGNTQYMTETDTAYSNRVIWFTAKEEDAEYTWYIGAEVIHEKQFYRIFDHSVAGQTLPMTLVVKKSPNTKCYPNDDGYDSITKMITFVYSGDIYTGYNHYNGNYRFKNDTGDSIDVSLSFENNLIIGGVSEGQRIVFTHLGVYIYSGDTVASKDFLINYKEFWSDDGGCFGRGHFDMRDRNNISLTLKNGNAAQSSFGCDSVLHFNGRKL